jgi:hypothetical protein
MAMPGVERRCHGWRRRGRHGGDANGDRGQRGSAAGDGASAGGGAVATPTVAGVGANSGHGGEAVRQCGRGWRKRRPWTARIGGTAPGTEGQHGAGHEARAKSVRITGRGRSQRARLISWGAGWAAQSKVSMFGIPGTGEAAQIAVGGGVARKISDMGTQAGKPAPW